MQRALTLAGRGWGMVHPNPMVGALVVRDGTEAGRGWHARYGGPHAEVVALEAAGAAARGATLYVTLEPCSHHGQTPPCSAAIAEAGIARVVYAAADPNPKAAGGAAWLRQQGMQVDGGVEEGAARIQNALFFHAHECRRPFLALKLAMSLDGSIAAQAGHATRITAAPAQQEVHRLRAGYDAILVGGATAEADNPLLTVRGVATIRPPVRVVIDPAAALPLDSRLVATADQAPVILLCADDADQNAAAELERRGVAVRRVPRNADGLDLDACLETLAGEGINSILCEGGGRLGAALLAANLVERLHLLLAPLWLGGRAVPAFPGVQRGRGGWSLRDTQALGDDAMLTWDRRRS
jgi:diaminohydroxyphosphoribosylaminopyrimidine deaminase / 5-amino-6-(5-phosphoribosylamino)uracil reductase